MPPNGSSLETPVLLMAMPQVLDPFFNKSVVLLIHHADEGSFGFIVNRPTEIHVAEILEGMEISWRGDRDPPAYFGGPVQPHLGTVLFDPASARIEAREELDGSSSEVLPGLRITQHVGDLQQLAKHPSERFRLFLGYAGWGEGQLVDEILRNDWLTAPVSEDILFTGDTGEAWGKAVRSAGLDPETLPSWTPGNGDSGAAN